MKLRAYHGEQAIKDKYVARMKAHMAADELVQNYSYWSEGKGCGVGCTIHSGEHKAYERELGVPEALARLEDALFERLPKEEAREFPLKFLEAIAPAADLGMVSTRWLHWLLTDGEHGMARGARSEGGKRAIAAVGQALERTLAGEVVTREEWAQLRRAAAAEAGNGAGAAAYIDAYVVAAAGAASACAAGADADARQSIVEAMAERLLRLLREAPKEDLCAQ